jgi:hypothetical protein
MVLVLAFGVEGKPAENHGKPIEMTRASNRYLCRVRACMRACVCVWNVCFINWNVVKIGWLNLFRCFMVIASVITKGLWDLRFSIFSPVQKISIKGSVASGIIKQAVTQCTNYVNCFWQSMGLRPANGPALHLGFRHPKPPLGTINFKSYKEGMESVLGLVPPYTRVPP